MKQLIFLLGFICLSQWSFAAQPVTSNELPVITSTSNLQAAEAPDLHIYVYITKNGNYLSWDFGNGDCLTVTVICEDAGYNRTLSDCNN